MRHWCFLPPPATLHVCLLPVALEKHSKHHNRWHFQPLIQGHKKYSRYTEVSPQTSPLKWAVAHQCNYFCLMKAGPSSSPERSSRCGLKPLFARLFTFVPLWIEAEVEALLLLWFTCITAFVSPAYLTMSLYIWKTYLKGSINSRHVSRVILKKIASQNGLALWCGRPRLFQWDCFPIWDNERRNETDVHINVRSLLFSQIFCMVHSWEHPEDTDFLQSLLSALISEIASE